MHPEIKKFWEDAGYTVSGSSTFTAYYEIHTEIGPIYRAKVIAHGNKYYFNKQWYSEEEALRIIKLKTFL